MMGCGFNRSTQYAGVWPPSLKPEMESHGKVGGMNSWTSTGDAWGAPMQFWESDAT